MPGYISMGAKHKVLWCLLITTRGRRFEILPQNQKETKLQTYLQLDMHKMANK